VIDGYVPNHDSYLKMLHTFLHRKDAAVRIFPDHLAYFNAVSPSQLPQVLIMGNVQIGMTGLELAAKLRREDYTGKIFIFTGDVFVQKTEEVDAVFYKPSEFRLLVDVINHVIDKLPEAR
jgi:FixJ family two-component response regulator